MKGKRAVVVGAGVVGCACARALARAGMEVIVVERHGRAGVETSSRNSGVIHAGIHTIRTRRSRGFVFGGGSFSTSTRRSARSRIEEPAS